MMQAASDIFLGWFDGPDGRHFYWRQLRDMKGSAIVEGMVPAGMAAYGNLCAWTLARAHARSGRPGRDGGLPRQLHRVRGAITDFSGRYAEQNERDYEAFLGAIKSGRLQAHRGSLTRRSRVTNARARARCLLLRARGRGRTPAPGARPGGTRRDVRVDRGGRGRRERGAPADRICRASGPWVAQIIEEWLEARRTRREDEAARIDPLRRGFLSRAEIDAAAAARPDLRAALRGDLQSHTTFTDGKDSVGGHGAGGRGPRPLVPRGHRPLEDAADRARHGRGGLRDQADEIEDVRHDPALRSRGFRVLHGIEMNVTPEGFGDMDPDFLGTLDIVLGTFHSKLRLTEDQTDRYLAAIRNGGMDVFAHPRCRMFGRRLGLTADWGRVFAEAAAREVALEVDCHPARQDLDVDLLRLAAEHGAWISWARTPTAGASCGTSTSASRRSRWQGSRPTASSTSCRPTISSSGSANDGGAEWPMADIQRVSLHGARPVRTARVPTMYDCEGGSRCPSTRPRTTR